MGRGRIWARRHAGTCCGGPRRSCGNAPDELARLITLETGKPIAQARGEIQTTANLFDHFTHLALEAHGESYAISGTYDALVAREPVGVVAAIVPWNFPIMMLAFKLAPALAVGCTVVCKPAELTNSIVAEVCEILRRAGVSDGALNMVSGQGTVVGAALAESPLVDRVTFTGSTDVGRGVMRGAAENLTRVGLELGGKSPHLVFADTARMDDAVDAACCNVFFNQGAVCDGGTRLLLERRIHDEFLEKLIAKTETLTVGDPMTGRPPRPHHLRGAGQAHFAVHRDRQAGGGACHRRAAAARRDLRRRLLHRADDFRRRWAQGAHRAGGDLRAGAGGADV